MTDNNNENYLSSLYYATVLFLLVLIFTMCCVIYQHLPNPTTDPVKSPVAVTPIKPTPKPKPKPKPTNADREAAARAKEDKEFADAVSVTFRHKMVEKRPISNLIIVKYDVFNRFDDTLTQIDGVAIITDVNGKFMFSYEVVFDLDLPDGAVVTSTSDFGISINKDEDNLLPFSVMRTIKFRMTFMPNVIVFEHMRMERRYPVEPTIHNFDFGIGDPQ